MEIPVWCPLCEADGITGDGVICPMIRAWLIVEEALIEILEGKG